MPKKSAKQNQVPDTDTLKRDMKLGEPFGGFVTLPNPNAFTGAMWNAWSDAMDAVPKRIGDRSIGVRRLYCYAAAEWLQTYGDWQVTRDGKLLPLDEVASWLEAPEDENFRLVSWISNTMKVYISAVMDPKG